MTVVKEIKGRVNSYRENMIWAVTGFCLASENMEVTSSLPPFLGYINGLVTDMNLVDTLRASTVRTTTGITADNRVLKLLISGVGANIMNAAFSYAVDNNNMDLAGQMKVATTEMSLMKNRTFIVFVQRAINYVTPIVGALASYGVTSTGVTTWQNLVDQLNSQLINPKNAIAFRKSINIEVQTLLRGCMDTLYNNCDRLALQLRDTNSQYYSNYKANRKLNPGGMSTQLRLWVLNLLEQPVTSGEVFIVGTDRSATLNLSGYALVDHIPFGIHNFTLTTPSGSNTFGPFDFKKGKSLTLHVQISTTSSEKSIITKSEEEEVTETISREKK